MGFTTGEEFFGMVAYILTILFSCVSFWGIWINVKCARARGFLLICALTGYAASYVAASWTVGLAVACTGITAVIFWHVNNQEQELQEKKEP